MEKDRELYISAALRKYLETIQNEELKLEILRLKEVNYRYRVEHQNDKELRCFDFDELKQLAIYNLAKKRIESQEMKEIDSLIAELKKCYFAHSQNGNYFEHNKKIDKVIKILELCKKLILSHKNIKFEDLRGATND